MIILMGDVPLLGVFADDTNFLAGSVWYHGVSCILQCCLLVLEFPRMASKMAMVW